MILEREILRLSRVLIHQMVLKGNVWQDKYIKGALVNFSLIPKFFFKKVEIFISLEVYTYVVTAC